MTSLRDESNDPLRAAFMAGWEMSAEGFNAEYGGPEDDEWMDAYYQHHVHGAPDPEHCVTGNSPYCSRPKGHDGPHSHHGLREWE